jgi:hypothetical protein
MITATIDAHEGRDVDVVDVPGAFLSADMDEYFLMTIKGQLAELMVKAAPNIYRKYITLDANNQPICKRHCMDASGVHYYFTRNL